MASLIGLGTLLAALGCLTGRLLGPALKVCPYRLGALLAAAFPTVVGLSTIAFLPEVQALKFALTGILAGMGACTGVFATGHRSLSLACAGALVGGAAGAAMGAIL